MKKIIKKIGLGIMTGFTIMTITMLIILLATKDVSEYLTKENMIRNIWCSAVVGIAFFLPSIIYDNDSIPQSIQTTIHMGIGYVIFFPLAIYAKWIPTNEGNGVIIITIITMLLISFGIWFGFYLFYKNEAKLINKKINDRKRKLAD
ncbi:DUF3021 domain-containing protein [Haploplasma axanthum]|nr:DUF3021 domain-containing protein [Haploplasma axanthum]